MSLETDLLVVINAEDRVVRVWKNSQRAQLALRQWQQHDEDYSNSKIPDSEYKTIDEWMESMGVKAYTTESRWDILP